MTKNAEGGSTIVRLEAANVKRIKAVRDGVMKICGRCEEAKSANDFYGDRSKKLGLSSFCRPCSVELAKMAHDRRVAKPKNNPVEKACGTCRVVKPPIQFWTSNAAPDGLMTECKTCRKDRTRRHRYGLTAEAFRKLMETQNGNCASCGDNVTLYVDHCHATGIVRALLCSNCNTAIGLMQEDPRRLRAAISYLEAHSHGGKS